MDLSIVYLIFLPLAILANETLPQSNCGKLWLDKRPDLSKRFQGDQIDWLCDRQTQWEALASAPKDVKNDDFISPKQLDWLMELRTCNDPICINDIRCFDGKCPPVAIDDDSTFIGDGSLPQPGPGWVPNLGIGMPDFGIPPPGPETDSVTEEDLKVFEEAEDEDVNAIFEDTENAELDPELEQKQQKVAKVCRKVLKGKSPSQTFPNNPNAEAKFDKWTKRCKEIRSTLKQSGDSLSSLAESEPDVNTLDATVSDSGTRRQKRKVARICQNKILAASNASEAFPNFLQNNPTKTAADLQQKFVRWYQKCQHIQNRLSKKGSTWEDWVSNGNKKGAKKPQTDGSEIRRRKNRQAVVDPEAPIGPLPEGTVVDPEAPIGPLPEGPIDPSISTNQIIPEELTNRATRKEYRMMSEMERLRFHQALNNLKSTQIDGISKYDLLTIYHTPQESPGAHWGPAFLPFHRELLKQLEMAIRAEDPTLSLPYWDSSLEDGLPDKRDSIIWSPDFFGSHDGIVTDGPHANWSTTHELSSRPGMRTLYRAVGANSFGDVYKQEDIDFVLTRGNFSDLTACIDPTFELVHGLVHVFVGGFMEDISISPNDPTFYFHHCFIDYLFEEFRQIQQTRDQRESDYPSDDESCNKNHFATSQMKPFPLINKDGLSNMYTDQLYFYDPSPSCTQEVPDCGSDYLWCETTQYRCISKVREGGNCTGFEGTEICFGGKCVNGRCVSTDFTDTDTTNQLGTSTQSVETTTPIKSETTTPPQPPTPFTPPSPSTFTESTTEFPAEPSTISTATTTADSSSSSTTSSATETPITTTNPLGNPTGTTQTPSEPEVSSQIPQDTEIPPGPETTTPQSETTTVDSGTVTPQFGTTVDSGSETTTVDAIPPTTEKPSYVKPPGYITGKPDLGTKPPTYAPLEPETKPPTYAPLEPETKPPTYAPLEPETKPPTYAPLEPETKPPTYAPLEPETKPPTYAPLEPETKPPTYAPLEPETKPPTYAPLEPETKPPTYAPLEPETKPPTYAPLEPETKPPTYAPLEPETKPPTYAPLEPETKPPTYAPLEPETKPPTYAPPEPDTKPPGYVPKEPTDYGKVWFTVSVIRGSSYYKQPVPGAVVESCGRDIPEGYSDQLMGKVSNDPQYPSYTGCALVQVMNPTEVSGRFAVVQAQIESKDEFGNPCQPMCYDKHSNDYKECTGKVRLSKNLYYSDPIPFKSSEQEAMEALWETSEDGSRKRKPDYLMFKCK